MVSLSFFECLNNFSQLTLICLTERNAQIQTILYSWIMLKMDVTLNFMLCFKLNLWAHVSYGPFHRGNLMNSFFDSRTLYDENSKLVDFSEWYTQTYLGTHSDQIKEYDTFFLNNLILNKIRKHDNVILKKVFWIFLKQKWDNLEKCLYMQ